MSSIILKNVSVDYPLYGLESQSFRHLLSSYFSKSKISHKVKTIRAIHNLNLEIEHGERVCIVGTNGSGKSTLLRVLAGIYPPCTGAIQVDGKVTTLIDPALGMDYEASGFENIYLRGYLLSVSKAYINSVISQIIEFSELGDAIHYPVRTYSSGMIMRLAFSITTAFPSEILLMDEWLSVGDKQFREKAAARLKQYITDSSILVLATNDDKLAESVSTRIIRLENGDLVTDSKVNQS